jgi:hypothetical protein
MPSSFAGLLPIEKSHITSIIHPENALIRVIIPLLKVGQVKLFNTGFDELKFSVEFFNG